MNCFQHPSHLRRLVALALLNLAILSIPCRAGEGDGVEFIESPGRIRVLMERYPVAEYVYHDPEISRPYFTKVGAPNLSQVTRNQPPREGDLMDHPTFHPGIWMAFGDLSGADNWRLTDAVEHVGFEKKSPATWDDEGDAFFTVRNRYRGPDASADPVCEEVFRCTFPWSDFGHLILWDSTFTSDHEFYFGDQEEMGLGIRVATPLRAQRQAEGDAPAGNGEILDAKGRRDEKEVWGESADWCDYSGEMDDAYVGMTIFCHPENFRPSWFHARDTGLNVANPFGRDAFHKGELSKIVVKPGESLRLRYGILVHSCPKDQRPDLGAAYREYVKLTSEESPND